MIQAALSHVAFLTRSLEATAARISSLGLAVSSFEGFPHEGTRECYAGSAARSARLLLLEASQAGPYRKALEKRGPGLHHLGVWVPSLEDYADQLGRAGWLLHAHSLKSVKKLQTVYFARPQVPFIVEAWEHTDFVESPSIEALHLGNAELDLAPFIQALAISNVALAFDRAPRSWLRLEGHEIDLVTLVGS